MNYTNRFFLDKKVSLTNITLLIQCFLKVTKSKWCQICYCHKYRLGCIWTNITFEI